jgi:hypothetical protein
MDEHENIFITTAIVFVTNTIQFFINRLLHNKDKIIERKYEAYSAFMKKTDEIMNKMRNDPLMIINSFNDFLKEAFNNEPEEVNNTLIKFNEKIFEFVRNASEPLMIIRQELNTLLLICSDELRDKIKMYNTLITDYNNEVQKCLSIIAPNDSNSIIRGFKTLGQDERWLKFQTLNDEISELMRKEIGNKKTKNSNKEKFHAQTKSIS